MCENSAIEQVAGAAGAEFRDCPIAEWWEDGIGAPAIPGSRFTNKARKNDKGVTYWMAQLPGSMGKPRTDLAALCRALDTTAARHAFVHAMNVAARLAAGLLFLSAGLCWYLLLTRPRACDHARVELTAP